MNLEEKNARKVFEGDLDSRVYVDMKKFGRIATMDQDLYQKSPLKDLYQKSPLKRCNTIYDRQGTRQFYNDTSPKAGINEMLGTITEGGTLENPEAMQQAVRYDEKHLTKREPSR